jgi:hypothetical protein
MSIGPEGVKITQISLIPQITSAPDLGAYKLGKDLPHLQI